MNAALIFIILFFTVLDARASHLEASDEFNAPVTSWVVAPEATPSAIPENPQQSTLHQKILKLLNSTADPKKPKPVWAFSFVRLHAYSLPQTVVSHLEQTLIKPASTFKLFTAWMAYKTGFAGEAYLAPMLQKSLNPEANELYKQMGGFQKYLDFYGPFIGATSTNFFSPDGSGLAHSNRATVDLEVNLLTKIFLSPDYNTFKKILVTPQNGTLHDHGRFKNFPYPLYAKTGTLRDTSSFAGYVEVSPSDTIIFSVIGNTLPLYQVENEDDKTHIDQTVRMVSDYVNNQMDHEVMHPWETPQAPLTVPFIPSTP